MNIGNTQNPPLNTNIQWIYPPNAKMKNIILFFHSQENSSPYSAKSLITKTALSTKVPALAVKCCDILQEEFDVALYNALCAFDWLLKKDYKANSIIIACDSVNGTFTGAILKLLEIRKKEQALGGLCLIQDKNIKPLLKTTFMNIQKRKKKKNRA